MDQLQSDLLALIEAWERWELSPPQVHCLAEEMWHATMAVDSERSDDRSIPLEVASWLDMFDHNLVVREDIPVIKAFLQTRPGEEESGWAKWLSYWDSIDYKARERTLVADPDYPWVNAEE